MPAVLARLRTGSQIDGNLCGMNERLLEDKGVCRLDVFSTNNSLRLLNLKRPQLSRVMQVLTGHCNLQRRKKTAGRVESVSKM